MKIHDRPALRSAVFRKAQRAPVVKNDMRARRRHRPSSWASRLWLVRNPVDLDCRAEREVGAADCDPRGRIGAHDCQVCRVHFRKSLNVGQKYIDLHEIGKRSATSLEDDLNIAQGLGRFWPDAAGYKLQRVGFRAQRAGNVDEVTGDDGVAEGWQTRKSRGNDFLNAHNHTFL